jgi:ribonuclease HII
MQFMLGVDEAGRGPLAGPVAVGVVAVPVGFIVEKEFPGVADSKKLSEKKREKILQMLEARVAKGDARFIVEFETAEIIDEKGIVFAVSCALSRGVNTLAPDSALVRIQLDGSLHAPSEYAQETIINGDELIPLISLASIAAKVSRDRQMVEFSKKYPLYGFEKHKGYGTKFHYEMLKQYGPCAIHRKSFLH